MNSETLKLLEKESRIEIASSEGGRVKNTSVSQEIAS